LSIPTDAAPAATTKPPPSRTKKVVSTILLTAIVLTLPAFGTWALYRAAHNHALLQPIRGGVETSGSIVKVKTYFTRNNTEFYEPVIRFTDRAGQPVTFTAPDSQSFVFQGEPVTVSYNPRHPQTAHDLSDSKGSWKENLEVGITLWVLWLVLGFFILRGLLAKRRSAEVSSA
jgi:hypothetical protein